MSTQTAIAIPGTVNPDLERERKKATFDPELVAQILHGDLLAKRRHLGWYNDVAVLLFAVKSQLIMTMVFVFLHRDCSGKRLSIRRVLICDGYKTASRGYTSFTLQMKM